MSLQAGAKELLNSARTSKVWKVTAYPIPRGNRPPDLVSEFSYSDEPDNELQKAVHKMLGYSVNENTGNPSMLIPNTSGFCIPPPRSEPKYIRSGSLLPLLVGGG